MFPFVLCIECYWAQFLSSCLVYANIELHGFLLLCNMNKMYDRISVRLFKWQVRTDAIYSMVDWPLSFAIHHINLGIVSCAQVMCFLYFFLHCCISISFFLTLWPKRTIFHRLQQHRQSFATNVFVWTMRSLRLVCTVENWIRLGLCRDSTATVSSQFVLHIVRNIALCIIENTMIKHWTVGSTSTTLKVLSIHLR